MGWGEKEGNIKQFDSQFDSFNPPSPNICFHTWMTVLYSVSTDSSDTSLDQSSSPLAFTLNSVNSLFSRTYDGSFCLGSRQSKCSFTTACPSSPI